MINRRYLLAGGVGIGANAIANKRTLAASAEIDKRCYVTWAYGSGENWWPATNFAIYATPGEAQMLKRRSGRIRVKVPYWTTDEASGFLISGGLDAGFNGDGYRFERGRFGIYVPGPRRGSVTLRVSMAYTSRTGRVTYSTGYGRPGRWIFPTPDR